MGRLRKNFGIWCHCPEGKVFLLMRKWIFKRVRGRKDYVRIVCEKCGAQWDSNLPVYRERVI
jgi:RNase P subunit RPR2